MIHHDAVHHGHVLAHSCPFNLKDMDMVSHGMVT